MSSLHQEEIWRPIAGYEGLYEISNFGRVKSLDRIDARGRRWKGRIMANQTHKSGHQTLRLCKEAQYENYKVHHLVLNAFVGPRPEGTECCHNDGNPANNRLENLRWDTRRANHADRELHGTAIKGAQHGTAKLTEDQVLKIRSDGRSQWAVAHDYGISQATVSGIKNRKRWGWL
jgi:DNA-binding CsgD family transcriptional regulator